MTLNYFNIWQYFPAPYEFFSQAAILFLPQIHERYGYTMEILPIIYASLYKRQIGLCVTVCMIALAAYSNFLTWFIPFSAAQMSIINLICYLKFSYDGLRYLFSNSDNSGIKSKETSRTQRQR